MQPGDSANGLWKSLCRFGVPDNKVRVEHRLEEGEPSKEILRVAAEVGCDLIVMGTHGRTGLERLVLGSVAERVLAKARCPVLTLKTPSVPSLEPCYDPGRCLHAGGRHSTEHNPMISG
jgi:hypothetical protein